MVSVSRFLLRKLLLLLLCSMGMANAGEHSSGLQNIEMLLRE
jgi:hypothetical protein